MKLQRQPNRWSCLPTSFAMALDIPVAYLIQQVGHDGSEKVSDQPEPYCRRSFHPQELIRCAWQLGFGVTEIQAAPQMGLRGVAEPLVVPNAAFFNDVLGRCSGVLTGVGQSGTPHAVAWDGRLIFDPNGTIYESKLFHAERLYLPLARSHTKVELHARG